MNCHICGSKRGNIYTIKEMMFGYDEKFEYFLCKNCGCLQIVNMPKEISRYYPSRYYSFNENMTIERNTIKRFLLKWLFVPLFSSKKIFKIIDRYITLHYLLKYFNFVKIFDLSVMNFNTKILDVGSGNGKLSLILNACGYSNILSIDPYIKQDINYENKVIVLKKELNQLTEKYDLIMFNHSFEHMSNPFDVLSDAKNKLNEKGLILLRIPTVTSFAWNYYKENWINIDAPRHFFLFSLKSLKILFSKTDLEIVKIFYDSNDMQFWGSEQYSKGINLLSKKSYLINPLKSIFTKSVIIKYRKQAFLLNRMRLGDTIGIYLKTKMSAYSS